MGRKKLPVVPKQKKIKLSKAQKQYAKMIHNIEADLVKKQSVIEALGKKLTAISAELARHNGERENLEGAKKNLEGILAQIPPPEKWTTFTKYVYEYHHHYHHHDNRPYPQPVYIGPWWQYYYGGGYITYPSQTQLQLTPLNPSISICDSPNMGDLNGGMFMCHNANLPGLSTVNSCFETKPGEPGITFTSNVSQSGAPVEYTKEDANLTASVTALASYGFFDNGAPAIDAADMSVGDLLKSVGK